MSTGAIKSCCPLVSARSTTCSWDSTDQPAMHPSREDSTQLIARSSDHKRHDANVESKILTQLENLGIPWNDVRFQKSEQTTLSARYNYRLKATSTTSDTCVVMSIRTFLRGLGGNSIRTTTNSAAKNPLPGTLSQTC